MVKFAMDHSPDREVNDVDTHIRRWTYWLIRLLFYSGLMTRGGQLEIEVLASPLTL